MSNMAASYSEIPTFLKSCTPFRGSSMSANGSPDASGYTVFSYFEQVAIVTRQPSGRLQRDIIDSWPTKTTMRAIRLCKVNLPGLTKERND